VALASTPETGVVVNSEHDVCDLETRVSVPGLIYTGWRGLQIQYLGHDHTDEDAYRVLRGRGHAVHVGPPSAESAASCWVADQLAAFDLLAQIAFAWSVRVKPVVPGADHCP
jgi:trehalose-6-phosphatase